MERSDPTHTSFAGEVQPELALCDLGSRARPALVGRVPEAREEARLFLAGNPNWRIGELAANSPFRSMSTAQPFINGWRLAGLPD